MIKSSISVIIPVYNASVYLNECLETVIAQTLENIEIICVDDCSTDASWQILLSAQSQDKRIKTFQMKENAGSGPARNKGIDESNGKYIAFMDPDDLYPDKNVLKALYQKAIETDAKILGGNLFEFHEMKKNESKDWGRASFKEDRFYDICEYPFSTGYTRFIYDRDWVINTVGYFPDLRRYQDPVWFSKALTSNHQIYGCKVTSYLRRVDNNKHHWDIQKITGVFAGINTNIKLFKIKSLRKHLKNEEKAARGFLSSMIKFSIKNNKNIDIQTLDIINIFVRKFGVLCLAKYMFQIIFYKIFKNIIKI